MISHLPIHNSIITHLAQRKDYTIQELYDTISGEYPISLSQFYKIIDQLLSKQILVKDAGQIMLHTTWMLSLFSLTEQVKQTYMPDARVDTIDLREGEQKTYVAPSLESLDTIRGNLYSLLCVMHPDEAPYVYHAHPYYILGMYETEKANFRDLGKKGGKFLVGNSTPLDQHGIELMHRLGVSAVCTDRVAFLREGFCANVIGDYIIEVLFPDVLTHYFSHFFSTTTDSTQFRADLFHDIFTLHVGCKCTIRRSKKQAAAWKKERKKHM